MTLTKAPAGKPPDRASSLAARVAAAPHVLSPDSARAVLERDLGADLTAFDAVFAEYPKVRPLIEGIAEGSPYLWDLIRSDPARLVALLKADPDPHLVTLLASRFAAVETAADENEAMRQLRAMKAEA